MSRDEEMTTRRVEVPTGWLYQAVLRYEWKGHPQDGKWVAVWSEPVFVPARLR